MCNNRPRFDDSIGEVVKIYSCGCVVIGHGTKPDPWHIHQCPTHAAAPRVAREHAELVDTLRAAISRTEIANRGGDSILSAWLADARTLLAQIEGEK